MAFETIFGNGIINIIAIIAGLWVIYDVWTKLRARTSEKVIWTICAILLQFSIITAIVYYVIKKR